ncbi:MAG: 16S rRNA (cytosine(1402)-N(4))-methyltransferase RsmH [Phycisphaerales bacterium]|nr:16S rRNA (cytosine(1402)-N(4))-methyltransferase RsmH [Phycisphaerales bacterium]
MADTIGHVPVLLGETLRWLDPQPGQTIIDATAGRGGHSAAIAERVGPAGLVIGFDLDAGNLEFAGARVREAGGRFEGIHASFAQMAPELQSRGLRADGLLADLGISSSQLDDPERGFSFMSDGPLDMRLDTSRGRTAAELLAVLSESELADLIFEYGEDPFARKIARKLTHARAVRPIGTTALLAQLVKDAYGSRARASRLHPATRTFMALRIAVNDELAALDGLLDMIRRQAASTDEAGWLSPSARIVVISFHSLEDRRVKRTFAELHRAEQARRLTTKPITASESEVRQNPRARSAKLRAIEMRASRMDPE